MKMVLVVLGLLLLVVGCQPTVDEIKQIEQNDGYYYIEESSGCKSPKFPSDRYPTDDPRFQGGGVEGCV
tara:strand:+ start:1172 stop:1378 length:207 start_codon:yes stop_codon:yes gene_type:complete